MKYRLLLLCLFLGCGRPSNKPNLPPLFDKGDSVAIRQSQRVGIILKVFEGTSDSNWERIYTVMFRDTEISYREPDLILVEHYNWNRIVFQAEVETDAQVAEPE